MRWIGFARYGEADPAILQRGGYLTGEDYRRLRRAQDFLLRLRNELHFHAKGPRDVDIRIPASGVPGKTTERQGGGGS